MGDYDCYIQCAEEGRSCWQNCEYGQPVEPELDQGCIQPLWKCTRLNWDFDALEEKHRYKEEK